MKHALFPGVWDLLHPGDLFALDWASKHCDHLTVAIDIDPTIDDRALEEPIESDIDRFVRLLCCKFVDSVVYYEGGQELETLFRSGYYNIAFISEDMRDTDPETHGVEKIYVPRLSEHSLGKLIERIQRAGNGNYARGKVDR